MPASVTCLVTGANRGIGKGFVSVFLQKPSATVIAAVRDPSHESSKELASLSMAEGAKLILVKIDSTVEYDPADAVSSLQKDYGITSLDVVVSNAGISHSASPLREFSSESTLQHFAVNSVAPMVLFSAIAPLLEASSQNPVFVAMSAMLGSISGQDIVSKVFDGHASPYGPSKAALNWFMRRLHFEQPWLTSFVFHPGLVETDMSRSMVDDLRSAGAISVAESVKGMVAVLDGATREISGTFKSYDGTDVPW